MKLFKTKRGYLHFSIKGLLKTMASIFSIPIYFVMFTIFKPRTYFDLLARWSTFASIRELLALQVLPDIHIRPKVTSYRDPYRFATVYREEPNTLVYDKEGLKEDINPNKENDTIINYIKTIIQYIKNNKLVYEDR